MNPDVFEKSITISLIGEANVGKTSMARRFVDGQFDEGTQFAINSAKYKNKKTIFAGYALNITIRGTGGSERFGPVGANHYRDIQGAIFVYDVTKKNTFDRLEIWLEALEMYCNRNMVIMIVGNKIDLPNREVSMAGGLEMAQRHGALFTECSAKTSKGITGCFERLVQKFLQTPGLPERNSTGEFGSTVGGGGIFLCKNDPAQESPSTCCNSG